MADDRTWSRADHRRFALRYLPPGEFRDEYLEHLDGRSSREPAAPVTARTEAPAGTPRAAGGAEAGWTLKRYALAAVGSVAFACAAWLLSALL